jgi:hypothetical protein
MDRRPPLQPAPIVRLSWPTHRLLSLSSLCVYRTKTTHVCSVTKWRSNHNSNSNHRHHHRRNNSIPILNSRRRTSLRDTTLAIIHPVVLEEDEVVVWRPQQHQCLFAVVVVVAVAVVSLPLLSDTTTTAITKVDQQEDTTRNLPWAITTRVACLLTMRGNRLRYTLRHNSHNNNQAWALLVIVVQRVL